MSYRANRFFLFFTGLFFVFSLTGFGQSQEFTDSLLFPKSYKYSFNTSELTIDSSYTYTYENYPDSMISSVTYRYSDEEGSVVISEILEENESWGNILTLKSRTMFLFNEMGFQTHRYRCNFEYTDIIPYPSLVNLTEKTFSPTGKISETLSSKYDLDLSMWVYTSHVENNYNSGDTLLTSYKSSWIDSQWEPDTETIHEYDLVNGIHIILENKYDTGIEEYVPNKQTVNEYDLVNDVQTATVSNYDSEIEDFVPSSLTIDSTIYNPDEIVVTTKFYWSEDTWVLNRRTTYIYNSEGNNIERISQNYNTETLTYDNGNRLVNFYSGENRTHQHNFSWDSELNQWILNKKTYHLKYFLFSKIISTNAKCKGDQNGTAKIIPLSGTSPFTYQWDDDNLSTTDSISGLAPNRLYTVLVTDDNGLTATQSAYIEEPVAELASQIIEIKDALCAFESYTGSANVSASGGVPPYEFNWKSDEMWFSGAEPDGIPADEYTLEVVDYNGCTVSEEVEIGFQSGNIVVSPTISEDVCENSQHGYILLDVSGGIGEYTYGWSNGDTTMNLEGIKPGQYSVSIIDSIGCGVMEIFQLGTKESTIQAEVLQSDYICPGSEKGFINLEVSGGVGEYSYDWSNGGTTENLTGLGTGIFEVLIRDEEGCQLNRTFQIKDTAPYENQEICLVTVDNDTEHNQVVWEQTTNAGIQAYRIYRESNSVGVYNLVGEVPYEQKSIFVDETSDSRKRAYQYKMTIVDTCGNESDYSLYHRTLLLSVNAGIGTVNLHWSNYELEGDNYVFEKYLIYRGSSPSNMEVIDEIGSNYTDYIDNNPSLLNLYYQIAGIVSGSCNPTGSMKAAGDDYNEVRSNLQANEATSISGVGYERLKVYPNPFTDITRVLIPGYNGEIYKAKLFDITGTEVKSISEIESGTFEIIRGSLPTGIYFLELKGEKIFMERVVIR